jgi:major type 1 subunit fimbrin (pilin)
MSGVNVLNIEGNDMKVLGRIASVLVRILACCIAACVCSPGIAWASATCHVNPPLAYTLNFPASVAVARDLPNGSQLTTWVQTASNQSYFTCNVTGGWYTGVRVNPAGIIPTTPTTYKLSYNGTPFAVYATNVPGIGMALGGYIFVNTNSVGPISMDVPFVARRNFGGASIPNGGQIIAALVKIGDVTPGTVSGQVAQGFSFENSTSSPNDAINPATGVINFDMTPVVITVLTCQTPDVTVPMGTQMPSNFSGVGSASNKSSSFQMSLNNCPAGVSVAGTMAGLIHSIQYKIDPSDGLVPGFSNVASLSGSTKAGGVGVQLYDSTGAVFPLSTFQTLGGFDGTRNASYTIPLVARYFQTGAITAGPANATMTMTVSYQ